MWYAKKMRTVYLDNSATTRCSDAAAEMMMRVLMEDYGNPSSLHTKGSDAELYLKAARETVSKTLKCAEKEIVFTSGGTEANNLAIFGAAETKKRRGRHIITTPFEHPSVANPIKRLEDNGYEVTYLHVDQTGQIDLEELENAIRDDTILVSLMHINNEIGTVLPVEDAARILRAKNGEALFHVDAIQSYGKLPLYPSRTGIDLLSVSGHKFHAPKGSGFLYVREKSKLLPRLLGGGQENGFRSGTENVPAIAGLGIAADEMYRDIARQTEELYELRLHCMERLAEIDGVMINGAKQDAHGNIAPQIVSVSVEDVRAEVLLHALEDKGIFVSAGSACSSNKPAVSRTLKAIGLRQDLLDKTIRLSLSRHTTRDEIDYAVDTMQEIIPTLRKYVRH